MKTTQKAINDTVSTLYRHSVGTVNTGWCRKCRFYTYYFKKKKYIYIIEKGGGIEKDYICGMELIISLQIPNAMVLGWEWFQKGELLDYSTFSLHLGIVSVEIRWDIE